MNCSCSFCKRVNNWATLMAIPPSSPILCGVVRLCGRRNCSIYIFCCFAGVFLRWRFLGLTRHHSPGPHCPCLLPQYLQAYSAARGALNDRCSYSVRLYSPVGWPACMQQAPLGPVGKSDLLPHTRPERDLPSVHDRVDWRSVAAVRPVRALLDVRPAACTVYVPCMCAACLRAPATALEARHSGRVYAHQA